MKLKVHNLLDEAGNQYPATARLVEQLRISGIEVIDLDSEEEADGQLVFDVFADITDPTNFEGLATLTNANGKFLLDIAYVSHGSFIRWINESFVTPVGVGAALYVLFNADKGFAMLKGKRGLTFPGGKIEPGETPEAACIREVMEETGMIAKLDGCFPFQMMCGTCLCHVFVQLEDNKDLLPDEFGPSKEFEHEGEGVWSVGFTTPSKFPDFNNNMHHTVLTLETVKEFLPDGFRAVN